MQIVCSDDTDDIGFDEVDGLVRAVSRFYAPLRRTYLNEAVLINNYLNRGMINHAIAAMRDVYRLPKNIIRNVGFGKSIDSLAYVSFISGKWNGGVSYADISFQDKSDDFLDLHPYLRTFIIAHELAHVRMCIDGHPLFYSEFTNDILTTMIVGNFDEHLKHMYIGNDHCGYIRRELVYEVFRCLNIHAGDSYF